MNLKTLLAISIAPFPSFLKIFFYRNLLGYDVSYGARIGISAISAGKCRIGKGARIGHFNFVSKVGNLDIGCDAVIGHFNIILGGCSVHIADRAMIGRFNEINSILDPLTSNKSDPSLLIGRGAVITAWHKIDYTDRVEIGENAILAGRLSNLWTHNRQETKPVRIGRNCYVGSGIQMVPGSSVGDFCVVGLGSVITKPIDAEWSLVAGVPARVVKPLDPDSRIMVEFPTRPDLVDPVASDAR